MIRENKKPKCVIFGAGGHARVIIDSVLLMKSINVIGIVDNNEKLHNTSLMGIKILGDDSLLPCLIEKGATHFVMAIGSVGDTRARRRLSEKAMALGLKPVTVIHPSATVSKWAVIEDGAQILANSAVNAESKISQFAIINTGAIVEHNCKIGEFTHVAPGAKLGGGVVVGNDAHIGIGATIRERILIGNNALIGAGSVVVSNVPANKIFVGVPAKELKK